MATEASKRKPWSSFRTCKGVQAAAVIAASAAALTAGSLPASAATNSPYTSGTNGYDVSYPQCPGTTAPSAASGTTYTFAIIGIGGGRPFTSNTCASAETATATGSGITNISYYFNTGYAGAYAKSILKPCATEAASGADGVFAGLAGHALKADQQAWEIGCSEALYAQDNAPTVAPTMWWADVETGNSWSTNTTLNDFTLDGLSYQMQTGGAIGGFYSYGSAWNKIAGTSHVPTPAENGNWTVGSGNFNTATQYVTQTGSFDGVDTDAAP